MKFQLLFNHEDINFINIRMIKWSVQSTELGFLLQYESYVQQVQVVSC